MVWLANASSWVTPGGGKGAVPGMCWGFRRDSSTDLVDFVGDVWACLLEPGDGAVTQAAYHSHQSIEVLQLVELLWYTKQVRTVTEHACYMRAQRPPCLWASSSLHCWVLATRCCSFLLSLRLNPDPGIPNLARRQPPSSVLVLDHRDQWFLRTTQSTCLSAPDFWTQVQIFWLPGSGVELRNLSF